MPSSVPASSWKARSPPPPSKLKCHNPPSPHSLNALSPPPPHSWNTLRSPSKLECTQVPPPLTAKMPSGPPSVPHSQLCLGVVPDDHLSAQELCDCGAIRVQLRHDGNRVPRTQPVDGGEERGPGVSFSEWVLLLWGRELVWREVLAVVCVGLRSFKSGRF